jgi:hypothetical protein
MIIKIMGIGDLLCAIILILLGLEIGLSWTIIFIAGAYLLLKVIIFIFSFNLASAIDLFACLCLLFSLLFTIPNIAFFIAAALVGQKGLFSLIG